MDGLCFHQPLSCSQYLPFTHQARLSFLVYFQNIHDVRPSEFIGIENYNDLFADPTFWLVVKNNLFYAAITIPVSIVIALSMALWANSKIPARGFVRTAYFTPTVLPMIAAANLWLFFYTPGLGVLDQIGSLFGLQSVKLVRAT